MATDLLVSAREVDDGPGGGWMALVSTAVTLVLLVAAGVWWIAAGNGGEGGAAGKATAPAGAAPDAAAAMEGAKAGTRPWRCSPEPECLETIGGMEELYREQGVGR